MLMNKTAATFESFPVGPAWSGHRVNFDFIRRDGRQFVAYYDADRRITLAARRDGEARWHLARPEGAPRDSQGRKPYEPDQPHRTNLLPWDSHNSLNLGIDRDGHLHLSGNLHNDPLVYYRSREPWDIESMERLDRMIGRDEERCTYPRFLEGPSGELLFRYRDGQSGAGRDLYNRYDPDTGEWSRLLEKPLLDGGGEANAYASEPLRGPDGRFHLIWVWRDTGDCATNHDLSYMRSADMVHWENVRGEALSLPVGLEAPAVVDPVPPGGGLLNGRQWLGFDRAHRPVIAYTKYDDQGYTQAWTARFDDGRWAVRRATDWHWRWEFSGGGSMPNIDDIHLDPPAPDPERPDQLRLGYRHKTEGEGVVHLRESDLTPVGQSTRPPDLPPEIARPESDNPAMRVYWKEVRGDPPADGSRLVLRWESLPPRRDGPPPADEIPPPASLRVYAIHS